MDRLIGVTKNVDDRDITNSYTYENDKIKTITHNGFSYSFDYDSLGNNIAVNVGSQNLIKNNYDLSTGNLLQSDYGNLQTVSSDYDNLDRVITRKYNGTERYKYQYDAAGNLGYHEDLVNNVSYRYVYDLADRLAKVVDSQGNSTVYGYDENNNKNKFTEKINGKTYDISYGYDKDNRPYDVQYANNHIMYTYDSLGRKTKDAYITPTQFGSNGYYVDYSYTDGVGGSTTTKVSSINFLYKGRTINYTYDSKGNIDTINDNNKKIKYYYNELNEVIREDNQVLNKTIVYSYDAGGNILTKTEYNYTTDTNPSNPVNTYSYEYGDSNWKDKLTSYNGKTITYDAIGNPLTYDGWTFIWEEGRQLSSMSKTGTNTSYKYNDKGIRTEKSVNGVVTKYHLNGDDVTYEDNGTDKIYYTYDSSGKLISMNLNGTEYYYTRNAQGDIIGLFDTDGNDVVSYTYDIWGKLISIDGSLKDTVGVKNPYRYRGYRYDNETGLYYLQSRYYNPELGRFINADAIAGHTGELLGHNIFAYCKNNVVNKQDPSGYLAEFNTDRWDDDYSPSQFSLSDYENFISNRSPLANFIEAGTGKTLLTGETLSSQKRTEKLGKGLDIVANGMIMCSTTSSRGSTGRIIPNNLKEKLAMEEVISDTFKGKEVPLRKGMTDPRWPAKEGWVKMTQNVNGVEIHYVHSKILKIFDDFKFKGK